MRTTTMDPLAEKYYDISPYVWCGNNPVKFVDPDGRAIETAWDLYSLYTGAKSFVNNVKQGNFGSAILDGIGVLADATAVVLPGVPGGVGAGIKAVRVGDKVADVVQSGKTAEKVVEGAKAKNLKDAAEKGIPQSQLGPSGKPKVHTVSKPNLKQAEEAARNNPKSNTSPVMHSSDKGQKTHYHSTKNGEKMTGKDNVHYENRSSKKNPK